MPLNSTPTMTAIIMQTKVSKRPVGRKRITFDFSSRNRHSLLFASRSCPCNSERSFVFRRKTFSRSLAFGFLSSNPSSSWSLSRASSFSGSFARLW